MRWARRSTAPVLLLLVLGNLFWTRAESEPRSRAAAVVAGIEGTVRIERVGASSPLDARYGDRLRTGDIVHADEDSSATIFFSGGHVVRVPAGNRLEIVMDPASAPPGSHVVRMSDRSLKVVEEGLWVLSDPRGDILLGAMRGAGQPAPAQDLLLSPRRETLTTARPTFAWASPSTPLHVVVATGGEPLWRSGAVSGSKLAYPVDAPKLQPGETYRWWVETDTGETLASPEDFTVPTKELLADLAAFESELESLVSRGESGPVKTLLRCAFYQGAGAWTPLLEIALAMEEAGHHSGESFAPRAAALARTRMGLTEADARRILELRSVSGG